MTGPGGEDWTTWIIGTAGTIVATLIGTVVTLTKYIEGKYRAEVDRLNQQCERLEAKSDECQSDREELRVQIARLEARQSAVEKKIS